MGDNTILKGIHLDQVAAQELFNVREIGVTNITSLPSFTATKKGRYTILYVFFLFVYRSDTIEIV